MRYQFTRNWSVELFLQPIINGINQLYICKKKLILLIRDKKKRVKCLNYIALGYKNRITIEISEFFRKEIKSKKTFKIILIIRISIP
ncbi:hypothetical protein BWI92_11440 [Flectobacillus sp. BAB-3569]|nr:hypothetical protein BWI92_11440 [Flectobacillus sp. BAB-3569]